MYNSILIALVVANLAITLLLWKKITGILTLVRTPLVKKLTPELNLRPVRKSALAGGENQRKNSRNNQQANNQTQGDSNPQQSTGNRRNNEEKNTRNDRSGDRNNKRFNNRNGRGNRQRPSTPSELYTNDATSSESSNNYDEAQQQRVNTNDVVSQTHQESATQTERPVVQHDAVQNSAPASSSRPPLPQRGAGASAESTSVEAPVQNQPEQAQTTSQNKSNKEERTIRHGRRTQVKKTPVFEEEKSDS